MRQACVRLGQRTTTFPGIIGLLQAINGQKAEEILDSATSMATRDMKANVWREAAIAAAAQVGMSLADAAKGVDLGPPPIEGVERYFGKPIQAKAKLKDHLQLRGPDSWRRNFDAGRDPGTGKRVIRYVTFHGTKREAQIEMARLITEAAGGNSLEPNKLTLAAYLDLWAETIDAAVLRKRRKGTGNSSSGKSSLTSAQSRCNGCGRRTSPPGTRRFCAPVGMMDLRSRPARSDTHIAFCTRRLKTRSTANC